MRGVAEGDTVMVAIDRTRSSVCMSVGRLTACGLAPSLAEGWGHLASLDEAYAWLTTLASIVWTVGLGVVLGATATNTRAALIRGSALAAAGLVASSVSPDVRPDATHAALLAASGLLGGSLRAPHRRRSPVGAGEPH
jgi:hypothetical protein